MRQIKNLLHCLLRYSEWSKLSWIIAIGLSWENANELRTISHRIFRISMQIKTLSCYFNYPQLLWAFFLFSFPLCLRKKSKGEASLLNPWWTSIAFLADVVLSLGSLPISPESLPGFCSQYETHLIYKGSVSFRGIWTERSQFHKEP